MYNPLMTGSCGRSQVAIDKSRPGRNVVVGLSEGDGIPRCGDMEGDQVGPELSFCDLSFLFQQIGSPIFY